MTELLLKLGELKLSISLVIRDIEPPGGAYLEWLNCQVKVEFRSFSGLFPWSVMPEELGFLADSLSSLYDQFPNRGKFDFICAEPNVSLSFEIGTRGQVEVHFEFRDELFNPVIMQGSFEMDQQSLPECALRIRQFVQASVISAA